MGALKSWHNEEVQYGYRVIPESGVLVILQQNSGDNEWTVAVEFSPTGWYEVSGFRYNIDTKDDKGTEGKVSL